MNCLFTIRSTPSIHWIYSPTIQSNLLKADLQDAKRTTHKINFHMSPKGPTMCPSPPHNHSLIRLTGLDAPLKPTAELFIAMSSSWLLVLLSSTTHNNFLCQYIISTTSATIINHSNFPPTTFHHRLLTLTYISSSNFFLKFDSGC